MLRQEGWIVNHKRVERIWREEGLKVPQKQPKRGRLWLNDGSCVRLRPERKDHVWAYDFVSGRTHEGVPLKMLTLVDEYTRECLAIDVARKLTSDDVLERLSRLMATRGVPEHIRSDNGPEFRATISEGVADESRREDIVHRTGQPVGERVRGKLQREAPG
jgi:putative transposase